jgi:hypothetical protein
MPSPNLLYKNISNTYQGLLHAQGETIPAVGQIVVTDGSGVPSALSIGRQDAGVTITGSSIIEDIYSTSITSQSIAASSVEVKGPVIADNTPRAWVVFNGDDGEIKSSFNVSSVVPTVGFLGQYTINFGVPLDNSNYVVQINVGHDNAGAGAPAMLCSYLMDPPLPSVSAFKIQNYRLQAGATTAVQFNPNTVSVVVYQ